MNIMHTQHNAGTVHIGIRTKHGHTYDYDYDYDYDYEMLLLRHKEIQYNMS